MIKELKSKFLKFVKSKKINVFTLFLLLSFTILILNKLSRTITNTIPFTVKLTNLPETYVILNDSSPKLNITLKTYGFKFLKYYLTNPKLVLDYNNHDDLNDSTLVWNKRSSFSNISRQFDKEVELISILPDTIRFYYDVNDTRKIPVILQKNITFSAGYDVLDGFKITPDTITIIGPEKSVSSLKQIKTVPLELQDVHFDLNQSLDLEFPEDSELLQFSSKKVKLKAQVDKFTEGSFNIPVTVTNVPKNITLKYYPKTVTVLYYTSLKNFKAISAKDFKVECDYNKHKENQSYMVPEIVKAPENIKGSKIKQQKIEFIISE
ncbi:YbbR-like domain-containing protein [Formosa sp. S-31]|uniref:YbbR-like domain-containing protein n=1 Tax=Formosa sp. S-31 TaxID=2790949 RepID=UPI003EBF1DA3